MRLTNLDRENTWEVDISEHRNPKRGYEVGELERSDWVIMRAGVYFRLATPIEGYMREE